MQTANKQNTKETSTSKKVGEFSGYVRINRNPLSICAYNIKLLIVQQQNEKKNRDCDVQLISRHIIFSILCFLAI